MLPVLVNFMPCFNPSQVGYKRIHLRSERPVEARFNPSQVGYKRTQRDPIQPVYRDRFQSLTGRLQTPAEQKSPPVARGFNPSQVGYKPVPYGTALMLVNEFQSLTGRLQTCSYTIVFCLKCQVSIPHR